MNRRERRLAAPHIGRKTRDNSRISGAHTGLNAHVLVAKTAVGIAEAQFELYMINDNALYKALRENLTAKQVRTAFLAKAAPMLLEEARLVLTDMLSKPDTEVPQAMKDEIADALIKDTDLRGGRLKAAEHMPSDLLH